jgi:hypothetical protein
MSDSAMLGKSGYERISHDFYATPDWCTKVLLNHVDFSPTVWEPACGDGAISRVLEAYGHQVINTDIVDRGIGATVIDFLSHDWSKSFPMHDNSADIVTNPPYGTLADDFVRGALKLTGRRVAMLMRNEWDCAASSMPLVNHPAFAMKIVLTTRPRWIEGTTTSPRHNYAWYVWDLKNTGGPVIRYDQ